MLYMKWLQGDSILYYYDCKRAMRNTCFKFVFIYYFLIKTKFNKIV